MPKGRGSNQRRRSWRQLHPRDNKSKGHGALMLYALYGRAIEVQKKHRKERKKQHENPE